MPPMDYSASSSFFEAWHMGSNVVPDFLGMKTEVGGFCSNHPIGSAIPDNTCGELFMSKAGGTCSNPVTRPVMGSATIPGNAGGLFASTANGTYCNSMIAADTPINGESCMAKVEEVFDQRGVNNFSAEYVADQSILTPSQGTTMTDHRSAWDHSTLWFRAPFAPIDTGLIVPNSKPKRRNVRISKDPQSVAARHRRERISEKIRVLQSLVPGGQKMDTASMLEVAIQYVKLLKAEVQKLENGSRAGIAGVPKMEIFSPPNFIL